MGLRHNTRTGFGVQLDTTDPRPKPGAIRYPLQTLRPYAAGSSNVESSRRFATNEVREYDVDGGVHESGIETRS